ncbi:hypothetical protein GJ496_011317 [Pomphorhynchus laevis]|nr:hypothetical protein GJ496_011317 [Pomphorhynchus laevis]
MSFRLSSFRKGFKSLNDCDEYEVRKLLPLQSWSAFFKKIFLADDFKENAKDDLIFFVRKSQMLNNDCDDELERDVDVFRIGSRSVPLLEDSETVYDWKHSVYLNFVLHGFEYVATLAICTMCSDSNRLQILSKHTKKVCGCPMLRNENEEGRENKMAYPTVIFTIDAITEDDSNILILEPNQFACVELVGQSEELGLVERFSIFLGSIRYEILHKALKDKKNTRENEIIKMKGPEGRGDAEVALSFRESVNLSWRQSTQSIISTSSDIVTSSILNYRNSEHNGLKFDHNKRALQRTQSFSKSPLEWLTSSFASSNTKWSSSNRISIQLLKISLTCSSIIKDVLRLDTRPSLS